MLIYSGLYCTVQHCTGHDFKSFKHIFLSEKGAIVLESTLHEEKLKNALTQAYGFHLAFALTCVVFCGFISSGLCSLPRYSPFSPSYRCMYSLHAACCLWLKTIVRCLCFQFFLCCAAYHSDRVMLHVIRLQASMLYLSG